MWKEQSVKKKDTLKNVVMEYTPKKDHNQVPEIDIFESLHDVKQVEENVHPTFHMVAGGNPYTVNIGGDNGDQILTE